MKAALRVCVACDQPYEYRMRETYPGKSTKRCPECQLRRSAAGAGNATKRNSGHATRNQHKRVRPTS
jgi:hypothetical protein